MEAAPNEVTIIDDGDDIYAVFAGARAQEIIRKMIPDVEFRTDPDSTVPPDCKLAAIGMCSDCLEGFLRHTSRSRNDAGNEGLGRETEH
jgi:hypothetical protein